MRCEVNEEFIPTVPSTHPVDARQPGFADPAPSDTEVPPEDEGKGIGARVVRAALEDTRRLGFKIVPSCSFVVAFVRRHPEFDDGKRA